MGLKVTVQVDTSVPGGGRLRIVNQAVTGPAGVGVPAGGTTGQVLAKTSNADYDTEWAAAGGGAPTGAQYVTLAVDGTLTDERVLTAGTGITVTDGGAGAAVTVATSAILPTIIDAKGDLIVGSAADTAARLAVGANGFSVVAQSSATEGLGWQAARAVPALPGEPSFVAGPYVAYGYRWPVTAFNNQTTRNAADAQSLHLWPFFSERPMVVSTIYQRVFTGQAGLNCRVGVYTAPNWPVMESGGGVSFTLLSDFGTFDCTSTGDKNVSGTANVHGMFFVGLYVPSTASAVRLNQAGTAYQSTWTNGTNSIQYWVFHSTSNYDAGLPSTVTLGVRGSNNLAPSIAAILEAP